MNKKSLPLVLLPLALANLVSCNNSNDRDLVDFAVDIKGDELVVLNLTDTQIIDPSQCRYDSRLSSGEKTLWDISKINELCFDVMDKMVEETKPDMITLGGDNVYGEFDDSGDALRMFVEHLDSYKIPFTFVYGNHDNESAIGRTAQTAIYNSSEYCMYKDDVTTVGIFKKNKLVRTYIMFDSNGCGNASEKSIQDGVWTKSYCLEPQIEKLTEVQKKIKDTPVTFIQHIPPKDIKYIYEERGYGVGTKLEGENEFGVLRENASVTLEEFEPYYSGFKTDNVLFGHNHINNLSIVENGIRYTFMTKTSYYDYYHETMVGGTVQKISSSGKVIETKHVYYTK